MKYVLDAEKKLNATDSTLVEMNGCVVAVQGMLKRTDDQKLYIQ